MQHKYRYLSNHSIMVVDRKQAALSLAAALLGAQGDTAAAGLEGRLRTVLEDGEEMPDVRHLIELLGRLVNQAGKDLDRADEDRWLADMQLMTLRRRTGDAKAALYAEAVRVRKTLVECYGAELCRRIFGFSERTPRGAEDLANEVWTLLSRLRDPDLKLPQPELAAVEVTPERWVARLRPKLELLERLFGEKLRRQVGAVDGVIGCRKSLASCDATYLQVARTAEALFTLAGCKELARRLRPSRRRLRKQRAATVAKKALAIVARVRAAMASFFQWLRGLLTRAPSTASRPTRTSPEKTVLPVARGRPTAPNA